MVRITISISDLPLMDRYAYSNALGKYIETLRTYSITILSLLVPPPFLLTYSLAFSYLLLLTYRYSTTRTQSVGHLSVLPLDSLMLKHELLMLKPLYRGIIIFVISLLISKESYPNNKYYNYQTCLIISHCLMTCLVFPQSPLDNGSTTVPST